jgi:hypothetical protein
MHQFIAKYKDQIQGVVSGFDRLASISTVLP